MSAVARSGAATRLPAGVELQLARLVGAAPEGDGWLHEVKFDGYRVLLWKSGSRVRITSRGEQDWSAKLPATVRAAARLPCQSAILDGELISLDAHGVSSFGKLQQRFGRDERALCVMVFDLLWLDGQDLRDRPQLARSARLATLMKGATAPLKLTVHTVGHGPLAAREACAHGLEGIISKDAQAPYTGGRSGAWLKVKCTASDEFAILAYTAGQGARAALGSLLLGSPAGGERWRYMGRVGTGFNERTIADLLGRLERRARPPPLLNPPSRAQLRYATPLWVAPRCVVEVEFRGYTEDGLLRQASLKGVRPDRSIDSLKPRQRDHAPVAAPGRRRR